MALGGVAVLALGCDLGQSSAFMPGGDAIPVDENGISVLPDDDTELPPAAPNGYFVWGNAVFTAAKQHHVFRGVARPSLEWNPAGEFLNAEDYALMGSGGWKANVVRIAVNQGFWLPDSATHDPTYAARIDENIAWAHAAGLDVILDLHWSDRGNPDATPNNPDEASNLGQQRMADLRSIEFWHSVAARYKDDGRVLFELYNEPHAVTPAQWRDGGLTLDRYEAAGMQQLYDAVRSQGAENLVIIGGLDWAYDLSHVPDHRIDGYNIVYATHPYAFPNKGPSTWDERWGFLTRTDPVIVTEFGSFDCDASYSEELIAYAKEHHASWTAWAWYPGGCDFPALIEDWDGTPSASGRAVRAGLQQN